MLATGQSLFTIRCAFCACSDFCACSRALLIIVRPLALLAVTPLGTQNSPVLHRTVRCYTGQSDEL
jgi:hypothetical protein